MTKLKILLLNPPFSRRISRDYLCPHTAKCDYAWPPMDLVAISGILAEHDLLYIDAIREQLEIKPLMRQIKAFDPAFIFMMASSISEAEDLSLCTELKLITTSKICLLGDIVSFDHARLSDFPDIDHLILDFTNSAQILEVVQGKKVAKLVDFSHTAQFSIGIPSHELFMKYNYYYPYSMYNHVAQVLTNYGCPFNCSICNAGNVTFKTREQSEVIRELQFLKRLGIREFYFKDFTFFADQNSWLLEEMIDRGLDLVFSCSLRIDTISLDILRLLKQAGCYLVFYGIESGAQATLSHIGKGFSNDLLMKVMNDTKRLGIETLNSFVIGFPDETEEDILETERLIFELDPDYLSLNVLVARLGSAIREETGRTFKDTDNSCSRGMITVGGKSIDTIRRRIERTFYFRPLKLLKYIRLALKSPFRVKNSISQMVAMLHRTA